MLHVKHAILNNDPHAACFSHVVGALDNAARQYPKARGTVCIGAHTMPTIPPDWIVWNFEQVAVGNPWMKPKYIALCRRNQVWDYSPLNVAAWRELYGIEAKLLPLGYDPAMVGVVSRCRAKGDMPRFYGSWNHRRHMILSRVEHRQIAMPCYGRALDLELSAAPCVLNVHFYESSIFEIVRCSYLFANAVPVMSEDSADQADYQHIPGLFPGTEAMLELARARQYPSGDAQRSAYMGAPWLSENLERVLN